MLNPVPAVPETVPVVVLDPVPIAFGRDLSTYSTVPETRQRVVFRISSGNLLQYLRGQVFHLRIHGFDEIDFPLSVPVLQLFLPPDCLNDRTGMFVIDKVLEPVSLGEALIGAIFVFVDSPWQITCDPM